MNKKVLYAGILLIPVLLLSLILWLISENPDESEEPTLKSKPPAKIAEKPQAMPGAATKPSKVIEAPLTKQIMGIPPMPTMAPPMPDTPPPMPAIPPPMPETPTAMPMTPPPMPLQVIPPSTQRQGR